ncbi:YbdD/YjiX family protein [Nocardioides rotundus]|uniref:YbdD/YjiX family protein n=1 Tax=Nocardioides rotundus TaxID=1774216 RepID=UPI001CC18352|nr:YbdD/YjiX family protein [Nocardioides rotundus]UAL29745.1 YbdD/YjiX family protein [Nocardioides rotundus]
MASSAPVDPVAALWRGGRAAVAYLRAIMGGDAYERYCEHLARRHPDVTPPTERQFWREHQDWQDRNPQGRCC